MATIYLALGSNVGDSIEHLRQAVALLARKIDNIEQSPMYRTKATGYTNQADFINAVICGQTALSPQDLLKFVKSVEQQVGRIERFRWGPREIDVDIILYDDLILESPDLTIPHARFRERDFVLRPLHNLAPDVVDPMTKDTISKLLKSLPQDAISVQQKLP